MPLYADTTTKLVLNILPTASMARLGCVSGDRMIWPPAAVGQVARLRAAGALRPVLNASRPRLRL